MNNKLKQEKKNGIVTKERWTLDLRSAPVRLAVSPDRETRFTTSCGRQRWQLNNGFLISRSSGGYNRAEWGATYLGPRSAFEQTLFAKLQPT